MERKLSPLTVVLTWRKTIIVIFTGTENNLILTQRMYLTYYVAVIHFCFVVLLLQLIWCYALCSYVDVVDITGAGRWGGEWGDHPGGRRGPQKHVQCHTVLQEGGRGIKGSKLSIKCWASSINCHNCHFYIFLFIIHTFLYSSFLQISILINASITCKFAEIQKKVKEMYE